MAGVITRAPLRLGKLIPQNTCLFLCDLQEKFRNSIQYFPQIVEVSGRLLKAFSLLELPVVATEQYPKGLGNTVAELSIAEHNVPVFDKTKFSMCLPPIQNIIKDKEVKSVVLCGIEAHVCVQQTALDLLESGIEVHVVVDACSSRSMTDRMYAFERLRDSGVFLTTSESVILGLAGGSSHPMFKQLQKIIWESAPDTGLLAARQKPLLAALADAGKDAKL
ncbi:isochorismatase domain-containing protein 2-like [Portunus trituberculatus]|uniref:Isochorismatase domain-containing protein 1 n=1 Tax=Portunus trituberculatus TaxID=210409 RepID=A0A5B7EI34_PORTR|nr:isochorismatase domain-containing protein 2-like [Portunus trituberculatus]MPC32713.1 Isochorismatase domain-containing protein 2 [Portunus trituberculatus]